MHNRHSTPRCLYPKSSGPAPSEQELSEDTRSAEHCAFSSLPLLAGRAAIVGMVCVAENSLRLSRREDASLSGKGYLPWHEAPQGRGTSWTQLHKFPSSKTASYRTS